MEGSRSGKRGGWLRLYGWTVRSGDATITASVRVTGGAQEYRLADILAVMDAEGLWEGR